MSILVVDYNSEWPHQFEKLKNLIWPRVGELAFSIEHVGSTSVPGLAAKPVIDIDIVISDSSGLIPVIEKLNTLDYEHVGDLGIHGREAFKRPPGEVAHNLYVCLSDSIAFRNHILLRDRLRADPIVMAEYAKLKRELAVRFADSSDSYVEGKTQFILKILASGGLDSDQLAAIKTANEIPVSLIKSPKN